LGTEHLRIDGSVLPDFFQFLFGVHGLRLVEPEHHPGADRTYGYVNPAIASYLGWQFLHEHLSGTQLIGMVVIIVGVSI